MFDAVVYMLAAYGALMLAASVFVVLAPDQFLALGERYARARWGWTPKERPDDRP